MDKPINQENLMKRLKEKGSWSAFDKQLMLDFIDFYSRPENGSYTLTDLMKERGLDHEYPQEEPYNIVGISDEGFVIVDFLGTGRRTYWTFAEELIELYREEKIEPSYSLIEIDGDDFWIPREFVHCVPDRMLYREDFILEDNMITGIRHLVLQISEELDYLDCVKFEEHETVGADISDEEFEKHEERLKDCDWWQPGTWLEWDDDNVYLVSKKFNITESQFEETYIAVSDLIHEKAIIYRFSLTRTKFEVVETVKERWLRENE